MVEGAGGADLEVDVCNDVANIRYHGMVVAALVYEVVEGIPEYGAVWSIGETADEKEEASHGLEEGCS